MLHSSENSYDVKSTSPASNPNSYNPVKTTSVPVEQATIGRSLVIKGELSLPDHRVTIGRNGSAQASITAREVVVMGKVIGNIDCSDRVDIRSEGSVTGDVTTMRISVEDGALLKGGIQVRSGEKKQPNHAQSQPKPAEAPKPAATEPQKTLAGTASS